MDKSRKTIAQDESRNAIADSKSSSAAVRKDGKYEGKQAIKEAAGEGPKTFEGGAHKGEVKHGKDGSHQGPKMYGAHKDKGPKMTSDSQSYRSSMSKHWHQSNLLSENPIVNHATEE